jgi:hypothetical protein
MAFYKSLVHYWLLQAMKEKMIKITLLIMIIIGLEQRYILLFIIILYFILNSHSKMEYIRDIFIWKIYIFINLDVSQDAKIVIQ